LGQSRLGRPFWLLWTALAVSFVGDGMVLVALPLLAVAVTHDALAVAGVTAVGWVPLVAAGLPVGAAADRANRRRLLVRVEAARFAALGLFGLVVALRRPGLGWIYLAAVVFGSLDALFDVAAASAVPSIVAPDALAEANSLVFNAEAVGQEITGRAVGGFALAAGRAVPFLADAASFVGSALLLRAALPDVKPPPAATSTWADLRHGLAWYARHPALRVLTTTVASLAFAQAMILAPAALWARQRLGLDATGFGLLLAVASVGDVLGALVAPRVRRALGAGPTIVAMAGTAAASYPLLGLTRSPALASALLAVQSAAVMIGNVAATTARQQHLPAGMQSRGFAANRTVVLTCVPLGGLAGGALAAAAGFPVTMITAGALQVAVLALAGPRLVRRLGSDAGATAAPAGHAGASSEPVAADGVPAGDP
jgi:predicted MFS family arabinose efflux permease